MCFFSSLRGRSDKAIFRIAPPRHCEPKGWQVCWREAISSLHIPFGVKCFEGIASLTAFARNDGVGLQARNDERGYSLAMTIGSCSATITMWDLMLVTTKEKCSLVMASIEDRFITTLWGF